MITEYDEAQKQVDAAEKELAALKNGRRLIRVTVTLASIATPFLLLAALKIPLLMLLLIALWAVLTFFLLTNTQKQAIGVAETSLDVAKTRLNQVSTKMIEEFNA